MQYKDVLPGLSVEYPERMAKSPAKSATIWPGATMAIGGYQDADFRLSYGRMYQFLFPTVVGGLGEAGASMRFWGHLNIRVFIEVLHSVLY